MLIIVQYKTFTYEILESTVFNFNNKNNKIISFSINVILVFNVIL